MKSTKVILKAHIWSNQWVYIRALSYTNEKHPYVDSFYVKDGRKEIVFDIPNDVQRTYKIKASEHQLQIDFITDVPEIKITADYIKGKFNVSGSPATGILQRYYTTREQFGKHLRWMVVDMQQCLKRKDTSSARFLSLKKQYNFLVAHHSSAVKHFLDTVSSPGVFMVAYNDVDYGKNYRELQHLMSNAIKRFPYYAPIKTLKVETDAYIDIYTHELQVGDIFPYIQLPDLNNRLYSTSVLKGKYYFIDFWATWCRPCVPYSGPKRQANQFYASKNFAMISVLLDDEKDAWKNIVKSEHFTWTQLIDEKQWRGPAARTIKFDSIPFNYLIAPDGKILAKSIKPNDLLKVLSKNVK